MNNLLDIVILEILFEYFNLVRYCESIFHGLICLANVMEGLVKFDSINEWFVWVSLVVLDCSLEEAIYDILFNAYECTRIDQIKIK